MVLECAKAFGMPVKTALPILQVRPRNPGIHARKLKTIGRLLLIINWDLVPLGPCSLRFRLRATKGLRFYSRALLPVLLPFTLLCLRLTARLLCRRRNITER